MTPESLTDAELWRRARDGDEHAFGDLFDRHSRTVYNYCFGAPPTGRRRRT